MADPIYVVTLKSYDDLDGFYSDMASDGYKVHMKRPISRNTQYYMTDAQAATLRNDSRVMAVEKRPEDIPNLVLKPKAIRNDEMNVQAGDFQKADSSQVMSYDWGKLHCAGTDAQRRKGTFGDNGTKIVNDTLEIFNNGKHVDIVTVDDTVSFDCGDWISPTTSASRFVQYEWYLNLNTYVGSIDDDSQTLPTGSYPNYVDNGTNTVSHGTHIAGTIAGRHYGWAPEANIYALQMINGHTGTTTVPSLLLFDYLRAFHRHKPINPETGRRNPTVTNHSYSWRYDWTLDLEYQGWALEDLSYVVYRGTTYDVNNPGPSGWTIGWVVADFGIGAWTFGYTSDNTSIRADAEDAVEDGVVVIGAAANDDRWASKNESGHPSQVHWNDTITLNVPNIGNYTWYSNRGSSPNNGEGIITVGSIESTDDFRRSNFSNYGPFIDVWAPGSDIVSVWPNPAAIPQSSSYHNVGSQDTKYGGDNWFWPISGTSMATPQVTGVAALLATGKQRFTNSDILAFIQQKGLKDDMSFNLGSGNFDDSTNDGSQNGLYALTDDHLELRSHNPRVTTGYIEGWYKGNLKGHRRPAHSFQNAQMYPRNNTYNRKIVYPALKTFTYSTTASGSGAYTITGDDRFNNYSSDNNPQINIYVGDTIVFSMNAPGHPLWISDTNSTGQPNNTSRLVPSGVSGNGTQNAGNVTWDTSGVEPGTYYYNCEFHTPMYGAINLMLPS